MAYNPSIKPLTDIMATLRTTTGTVIDASGNIATVPADTARIDYSDGQAALLVEAASTNLVPKSVASVANWLNLTSTLTDLALGALGVFPGVRVASLGANWNRVAQDVGAMVSGQSYAMSFWYKLGTSGKIRIGFKEPETSTESSLYGNPAGVLTGIQNAGSITDVVTTAMVGGVYKTTFVFTPTASTGNGQLSIGPYSVVAGEDAIALGAQLEAGTIPTSYIPTNGTSVTRAADQCSIDGSGLGMQSGYTLAARGTFHPVAGQSSSIFRVSDAGGNNQQNITWAPVGMDLQSQMWAGNVVQAAVTAGPVAYVPGTNFALAARFGPDNVRMARDGVLGAADTSGTFIWVPNITLGQGNAPARLRLKSILLYPALLSDAALTELGTV